MTTFNLVKAQKYVDILRNNLCQNKKSKSMVNPTAIVNINNFTKASACGESILDNFNKYAKKVTTDFANNMNVLRDLRHLKDLIYSTNAKNGLSSILTEISLLSEEREVFKTIKTMQKDANYSSKDIVDIVNTHNNKDSEEKDLYAIIKLYDDDYIDSQITSYNKRILELDEKRDSLNASTKIQFTFCDESIKILGL